jgi:hypothetical protein
MRNSSPLVAPPVENPNSPYLKGETPMKSLLVTGLLFCLALSTIHAVGHDRRESGYQKGSTNDQIEVKTDRFSNVTTVTLKPQLIIDKADHVITMGIKARLGEKKFSDLERETVDAYAEFESQSKTPVDFGDQELHFIINSAPLNLGKKEFKLIPFAAQTGKLKPDFRLLKISSALLNRKALESLSKAKSIEMRLGSFEPTLSGEFVATLREYAVQVLAQHKIAMERQQ